MTIGLLLTLLAIFFVMKSLRLRFVEDLIEYVKEHDVTYWVMRKYRTFNIEDAVTYMLIVTGSLGIYMYSQL